jgi:hypothetical protein
MEVRPRACLARGSPRVEPPSSDLTASGDAAGLDASRGRHRGVSDPGGQGERRAARSLLWALPVSGILRIAYKLLVNDKGRFAAPLTSALYVALGGGWWNASATTHG